jgi:hypothetical protein
MKQTQMVQTNDEWVLGWNPSIFIYTSLSVKKPTKLVCIKAYHVPTQKLALALISGTKQCPTLKNDSGIVLKIDFKD